MLRWLERNGYDVSYFADRLGPPRYRDPRPQGLPVRWARRVLVGRAARDVNAARDAGVHLAFLSGNEVYWKTRWESSTAGGGSTDYRTQVSTRRATRRAPSIATASATSRAIRTAIRGRASGGKTDGPRWPTPENSLSGQISWGDVTTAINVPAADAVLRFWRNAGMSGAMTLAPGTLGYEWDPEQPAYGGVQYPPAASLCRRPIAAGHDPPHEPVPRPSGALVFGAGTVQWSWGLDAVHDRGPPPETRGYAAGDREPALRHGRPASHAPGPGPATGGPLDTTAPTAVITDPAGGATVPGGNVTISGTAADTGAVWSPPLRFRPTAARPGAARPARRAGATPSARPTAPSRSSAAPWTTRQHRHRGQRDVHGRGAGLPVLDLRVLGDGNPGERHGRRRARREVPVRRRRVHHRASASTRRLGNTGTHTGTLWTTAGRDLGTVTFSGESATGWQEAIFDAPIADRRRHDLRRLVPHDRGNYADGHLVRTGRRRQPATARAARRGRWRQRRLSLTARAACTRPQTLPVVQLPGRRRVRDDGRAGHDPADDHRALARRWSASGVAVGANVTATFSEPVAAGVSGHDLRAARSPRMPSSRPPSPTTQAPGPRRSIRAAPSTTARPTRRPSRAASAA